MQIIDAIKRSADRYSQPDTIFGYGIPDFYAAHLYLNSMGQIDENTENLLNVFPNPFKNILNVAFYSKNIEIPYNSKLEVFDVQGKKVIDAHMDDVESNYSLTVINNIEKLSKGVYIVRFTAKDIVLQTKIVKL
jgi:methionine-rich copper-binding protein CopC